LLDELRIIFFKIELDNFQLNYLQLKMGNKGEKISQKTSSKKELTEKDYGFLKNQTGLEQKEIQQIFEQFNSNNPNQLLDKNAFIRLYHQLNPKAPEFIGKISEYVFKAFDTNHNGRRFEITI
jgi:hypothetical protein